MSRSTASQKPAVPGHALEDVDVPAPAADEAQVRHTAIGLNYSTSKTARPVLEPMPTGLGREAAGVIVGLGRKARGFRAGDRVAYVHSTPGS